MTLYTSIQIHQDQLCSFIKLIFLLPNDHLITVRYLIAALLQILDDHITGAAGRADAIQDIVEQEIQRTTLIDIRQLLDLCHEKLR